MTGFFANHTTANPRQTSLKLGNLEAKSTWILLGGMKVTATNLSQPAWISAGHSLYVFIMVEQLRNERFGPFHPSLCIDEQSES